MQYPWAWLFLLYLNNQPSNTSFEVIQFADETLLLMRGNSKKYLCEIVIKELNLVADWFKDSGLSLDPSYTKIIHFFPKKNEVSANKIYLVGMELFKITKINTSEQTYKYFRVRIDEHLRFEHHAAHISKSITRNAMIIVTA